MCKQFVDSSDAHISVYDGCNSWVDDLIEQFCHNKYTAFRNTLREVPLRNDGVLAYVKASTVFPLVEATIKSFRYLSSVLNYMLSKSNIRSI